ncbi:ankyrin repeat domain-containing protein [Pseudoalteromonas rubra]|uniref:Ankyrin repeat domain-containing protein n=1 Tax=Pseudoalteromonas rubra TaxID=43658 RepID=A0A5S3WJE2_9GAMM|nr:ankyrin repeat domain-containing protein [Pseudoalteromonas rubra]TMP27401.1 ankyrin repeat domain-containing protein [Pseudoalteromonas rubra]TMP36939.1 ankyrin repeat domain-containing protein [Pseudoalteromonas rubra]
MTKKVVNSLMEHVLIWPAQYPLLLKGLVENNGAFILDALEAWPECETVTDQQGVSSSVLPPLMYILWLKPLEPFESCRYQHIDDYDQAHQTYCDELLLHIAGAGVSQDELIAKLLGVFAQYADIKTQLTYQMETSPASLLLSKSYIRALSVLLQHGLQLTAEEACDLWKLADENLRLDLSRMLETVLQDTVATLQLAVERLQGDDSYVGLLKHLCSGEEVERLLDQALLAHLMSKNAKQSTALKLIEQGATGQSKDPAGKSAMMWLVEQGFVSAAQTLTDYHCHQSLDDLGRNLMHYAVMSNSTAMLELVESMNVDPRLADVTGMTPYRLANQVQAVAAKKFLEQRGIIELSFAAKYEKVARVYSLYALVAILMPVQLNFFFNDTHSNKLSATIMISSLTLLFFALARWQKRSPLYPQDSSPWSLVGVNILAWLSMSLQVLFSVVVLIAVMGS